MNNKLHKRVSVLSLLLLLIISLGCSERITETSGGEAQLRISASGGGAISLSGISTFTLTVTGPGIIEAIRTSLFYENGLLTGTVVVPAGPERAFLIEGFDESGALIYSGRTVTDVRADKITSLEIQMHPRIPMVRLSPSYQMRPFGATLAYRVSVHNLAQISSIQIRITNQSELYGNEYWYYADSVIMNPDLLNQAYLSYYIPEWPPSVVFSLGHRYSYQSILDSSGYRELATVYYGTYLPYMAPPVINYIFEPEIISMVGLEGDTLSVEDIYLEDSEALMIDPAERRAGFWKMDWESEDPDSVLDSSGNNLHGTANGTTWDEGYWGSARELDGVNDYISVPADPLLDIEDGITVSFNVKIRPGDNEGTAAIISKVSQGGAINYQILLSWLTGGVGSNSCKFIFRYGSPPYQHFSAEFPDIADNEWRNIVFSCRFGDPSSAILAVQYGRISGGTWVGGDEETLPASGPLLFGRQPVTEEPYYLDGGLDHIELYGIYFDWYAIERYFFPR
ncbi:MAG: hypothetical protein GF417_09685 [Candidatus Latescibacteria bacterium]|nr:hypothetical protein [bacterium]MBD3424696.1 hypothetical protein [Candidatus Latescibacterota bacterium]